MNTSEQINELAAALAKAQGQIVGAKKDSANPFFKSKYADLASCWDACRDQLSSNGLAVIQGAETRYSSEGVPAQIVTTLLTHCSGQWIESVLQVHPKDDSPQAAGSAITYARRYALAAIVGLAQVDDDAEAAQGRHTNGNGHMRPIDIVTEGRVLTAVEHKQVSTLVDQVRGILERDLEDDEKCLSVLDLNDLLVTQHNLALEAWKLLNSRERSTWKKLVDMGKAKERAEPPRPNGR